MTLDSSSTRRTWAASSQLMVSSPSVNSTTSARGRAEASIAPRRARRRAPCRRPAGSRRPRPRGASFRSWEARAAAPRRRRSRAPPLPRAAAPRSGLARRPAAGESRCPFTLPLASSTTNVVSGSLSTETRSTGWRRPSSRRSKSDAARPVTGRVPSVTKTSRYTTSTSAVKLGGDWTAAAAPARGRAARSRVRGLAAESVQPLLHTHGRTPG